MASSSIGMSSLGYDCIMQILTYSLQAFCLKIYELMLEANDKVMLLNTSCHVSYERLFFLFFSFSSRNPRLCSDLDDIVCLVYQINGNNRQRLAVHLNTTTLIYI